jgi:hypothetical protein
LRQQVFTIKKKRNIAKSSLPLGTYKKKTRRNLIKQKGFLENIQPKGRLAQMDFTRPTKF